MASPAQFLNLIDKLNAQRAPYARHPASVMIVTAVTAGYILCRRPYEAVGSGFQFNYLSTYSPVVGDKALVEMYPSGPVAVSKLVS